jgi:hypothetical protein
MYFGGKSFQSGDIVTSMSYTPFVQTYDSPLWNPLVFGGFPSAATLSAMRWYDFIATGYGMIQKVITSVFSVDYASYTFHLFILAVTMFFLMRYFKASAWVSLMVSLASVFSTGHYCLPFYRTCKQTARAGNVPFDIPHTSALSG